MKKANIASQEEREQVSPWQMPISALSYPDRHPRLSEEEKCLMQKYATAPEGTMSGGRVKKLTDQLARFEIPFREAMKLIAHTTQQLAVTRRYLFSCMATTSTVFWAWPQETWIEFIQAAPEKQGPSGRRFVLVLLAYVFCDFLYIGPTTPYTPLANIIFGKAVIDVEMEKVHAPLATAGFETRYQSRRWLLSLVLLINRHPRVEAISAQTLVTVHELLSLMSEHSAYEGRRLLPQLQTALCYLGILDEPVLLVAPVNPKSFLSTWRNDPTVDAWWAAWVCAFYEQTPHQHEKTIRKMCTHLLLAGRWLKQYHPDICEPDQWTEALANEYVTYTCQALCGDLILPSNTKYLQFRETPQRLGPASISHRLYALRTFFSHLQRRCYLINGEPRPKLQLPWLVREALKTPDDIRAARQPNPKDIQEDTWFKLIWAACTLTKGKVDAVRHNSWYPLAYVRAACLIWVTAARRSDEIRRLHLGCVRREWAPEMHDEHRHQIEPAEELCYLRIPTNKMRGDFYIPIPSYVADAIEVWESLRPPNQEPLLDRKTHKPTKYLFQYRGELMGKDFLNLAAIPLLCTLAGVSQNDIVGRITSHRARATTATWMHKMGMAPVDIGKLLGHTDPLRSLPWYLREDKHHLGRAYRKANPLERYVAAILDTNAHARQEPCVFYYLADGPDGRPRMCGNPHFSRCIHQMMCRECEAFIDSELAEVIEKREGALIISVPVPLPPQMVDELNEQDEAVGDIATRLETLPPPTLPGPAFHFNKKVPMRSPMTEAEEIHARLQQIETQIAKKQGKTDQRSASLQALLKERAELQARLEAQEKGP
jgi:integrase